MSESPDAARTALTDEAMTTEETLECYLAAVRAGERRRAFDVVDAARQAGLGMRELYLGVFQPALRTVGELWQQNLLSVAEEHFATAITQTAMLKVYGDAPPPVDDGPLLVAACAESERHEIGLRMLCDFMEVEGWRTVFLGATVPQESLVDLVMRRRPDLVALSAAIPPHLPQVRDTIAAIRAALPEAAPHILVGGRPFVDRPDLADALGADGTAADAAEAARLLRDHGR